MSYVVGQLGARMHYGVPRALYAAGMLERLATDIYRSSVAEWLHAALPARARPDLLKRLVGRHAPDLPARRVTAFIGLGLAYKARLLCAGSDAERDATHLWMGQQFGAKVVRQGFGSASGVYAYNTAALEVLTEARRQGLQAVLEQTIAPRKVEDEILAEERKAFPTWTTDTAGFSSSSPAVIARERAEWAAAHIIMCGSEFVRDGIAACGGPAERCIVVPYGVGAEFSMPVRSRHEGPLRVLVAGRVGLRKGSAQVAAAAKRLGARVCVRMVGPLDIPSAVVARLTEVATMTGPVPRADMLRHLAWADVFLLPSLCEGSATAVYEALTASLPVVCTANTGSVVRDGIDGIIVPPRDVDAIVVALDFLARQHDRREEMAANAACRAREYTFANYGRRLLTALLAPKTVATIGKAV